ncbi:ankyrin repeat domain-containing protein [Streptomyces fructofermentans]|uniref:ankyrin repeat domain-containing protein n=1 Tax=Streptomyces fructofermentans TaxID=152141 RepID=UPI0033D072B1
MDAGERLVRAAESGDAFLVARLLARGARPDVPDAEGRTPLESAVRKDRADVVRLLVGAGADTARRVGEYGETSPLCLAAMLGRTGVVGALLDAGVNPDTPDRMGQPALVLAATATPEGHPATVDLLLDRGAAPEITLRGRTALGWAACFGRPGTVRHLLARGAAPTRQALACARDHASSRPGGRAVHEEVIGLLRAARGPRTAPPEGG